MNRNIQSLLKVITILVTVNVLTLGMTTLIELTVQLSNSMYSAGYGVGTYLKDFFS
ncbi:hypothetical protein ACFYKX_03770 [Cytobacillus sp. FJAT-54145]|uniref:Uncharacterized protein n=1 Tax=Cytobacillus spartinae TaxID=3299023 RepID=A0ABW6K9Y4_9BACI